MGKRPQPAQYKLKLTELQEKIIVALIRQSRKENRGAVEDGVLTHIREKYNLTKSDLMYLMKMHGFYGREK